MQLRQPRNVVEVAQVFLQCIEQLNSAHYTGIVDNLTYRLEAHGTSISTLCYTWDMQVYTPVFISL